MDTATFNMDKNTFNNLRNLVYEKSGITLGEHKKALVCARVGKRMRQLGIDDFKNYFNYLVEDKSGEELVQFLDVISTNVTHFFREPQHFDLLGKLLPGWVDGGQRRIRIWSAASSTGEEPYSIAMTVRESLRTFSDVKILATDISTRVLNKAREGIYEERHVEKVPPVLLKKYFQQGRGEDTTMYRVKDSLGALVTFGRLNLAETPYPLKGPLDVIFCRNVMIYFDNEVRNLVLRNMFSLLKPGGYLMVGHAESLTGLMSDFKSVMPSVYVKT